MHNPLSPSLSTRLFFALLLAVPSPARAQESKFPCPENEIARYTLPCEREDHD